mgnify:CR=1 FL=1
MDDVHIQAFNLNLLFLTIVKQQHGRETKLSAPRFFQFVDPPSRIHQYILTSEEGMGGIGNFQFEEVEKVLDFFILFQYSQITPLEDLIIRVR